MIGKASDEKPPIIVFHSAGATKRYSRKNPWEKLSNSIIAANSGLNGENSEDKDLVENVKEWRLTSLTLLIS